MPRPNYPTAADFAARLQAIGLLDSPPTEAQALFDLESTAAAAAAKWEQDVGWLPFLASEQVRRFNPPGPEKGPTGIYIGINNMGGGRILFFASGLLEIHRLTTQLTVTNTVGKNLTLNQDYWLRPESAPQSNRPYTYAEFGFMQYGDPHSIEIDGVWGFAYELPDDAWQAVLDAGVLLLAPELAALKIGPNLEWKSGTTEERYNPKPYQALLDALAARYERTRSVYRRKAMV